MAESVVKLRVDSGEYDSKIKRAAQNVLAFGENCQKAGQSMAKADKEAIEYVRSLGQMETVAKNTKGKIGEMTTAFTDLSMQYRKLTNEEKQSPFGQALSQSLEQLKIRIKETKDELSEINNELSKTQNAPASIPSGGLLGGGKLNGMLQVFGGNIMTKAAGWAASLVSEMGDAIQQGIELAKAGEGIRLAFEKLNRPDLLDKLREATHGTVTDLELMKQAVKFDDFNLSLDEMGTMLAFAQQKAKDTGQSVDYMVDSIVTGLGRKSLMILDNLGLSAADIKAKMGETGDMTKAVGEIIREQMSKAGDYIETAADRAAKADAEVKNAMEELGRTFQPLSDAGSTLWHNLKVGALDFLNNALKPVIDSLTEVGRQRRAYENAGGDTKVNNQVSRLKGSNHKDFLYKSTVSEYNNQINELTNAESVWRRWRSAGHGGVTSEQVAAVRDKFGTDTAAIRRRYTALRNQRDAYMAQAQSEVFNPVVPNVTPSIPTTSVGSVKTSPIRTGGARNVPPPPPAGSIAEQEAKVQALTKAWREATDEAGRNGYAAQLEEAKKLLDEMQGKKIDITPEGSFKDLKEQLQDLQKQRELLSDPIEVAIVDEDIQRVKDRIDELNGKIKTISQPPTITLEQKVALSIAEDNIDTDIQTLTNLLRVKIENGLDDLDIPAEHLQRAILGGEGFDSINIPDEYWQHLVDEINTKLADLGIDPITLDVRTGNLASKTKGPKGWEGGDKAAAVLGQISGGLNSITSGIKQLGIDVPDGIERMITTLQVVQSILTGISSIVLTISMLTAAKSVPVVGAFLSTGGIAHAAGGLLTGHHYSNDQVPVMVNDGELILNRAQQGVIADALDGGATPKIIIEGVVDGENLRLVQRNSNRMRGRGEYVTTKSR